MLQLIQLVDRGFESHSSCPTEAAAAAAVVVEVPAAEVARLALAWHWQLPETDEPEVHSAAAVAAGQA